MIKNHQVKKNIMPPRHENISFKFREKFVMLWGQALKAGYSSNDARDYASLELDGRPFHGYDADIK
jgi:hypothetical protein